MMSYSNTYEIQKFFYKVARAGILFMLIACSSPRDDLPRMKYWHAGTERPYVINGVRYYPQVHYKYDRIGYASWYGYDCHGLSTATGRTFNKNAMTAAHRTLPLPCVVLVENLSNGKKVKLLVNDRGPFAKTNSKELKIPEMFEIPSKRFFISCQYHPEFLSRPFAPHPLFRDLIKSAKEGKKQ